MADALQLRLLTPADLPAVTELSKEVYSNYYGRALALDYLPYVFGAWTTDPQRRVYGLEHNGTLIAIESFAVIDDGNSLIFQAGRVRAEWRGRGILAQLERQIRAIARRDFPQASKFTGTFNATNTAIQQQLKRTSAVGKLNPIDAAKMSLAHSCFWFDRPRQPLHTLNGILPLPLVDSLCPLVEFNSRSPAAGQAQLVEALTQRTPASVFPSQHCRFVTDWVPYAVSSSNILLLLQGVVARAIPAHTFLVEFSARGDVCSFSHAAISVVTTGRMYSITIYATSPAQMLAHLKAHLLRADAEPFVALDCLMPEPLRGVARRAVELLWPDLPPNLVLEQTSDVCYVLEHTVARSSAL
eukprot:TRINITY_DN10235_c0_g1_i1.p1 TRINITY_DN10235_c0_g1~~TRINITY_DN10235_c0_g1_i1.p1  ORF type:complete len:356 (-),score=85.68 TRINITY_DN10235_c0_g1_i1:3-1070(-)